MVAEDAGPPGALGQPRGGPLAVWSDSSPVQGPPVLLDFLLIVLAEIRNDITELQERWGAGLTLQQRSTRHTEISQLSGQGHGLRR